MGGDDMFYIIENLQHYLMSEEIVKMKETQNGLFLGWYSISIYPFTFIFDVCS